VLDNGFIVYFVKNFKDLTWKHYFRPKEAAKNQENEVIEVIRGSLETILVDKGKEIRVVHHS